MCGREWLVCGREDRCDRCLKNMEDSGVKMGRGDNVFSGKEGSIVNETDRKSVV